MTCRQYGAMQHQKEQKHGHPVFSESAEGRAPVGVVAGAGELGLLRVKGSKGEQLLLAQVALELRLQAAFFTFI